MKNSVNILFVLLLASLLTNAQSPAIITHTGYAADALGNPIPDGNYSITFRLYELETGGTAIWDETDFVQSKQGYFVSSLGDQNLFFPDIKFDQQYWLGISVGSMAEIQPRIKISDVPRAIHATYADTASFAVTSGNWNKSGNTLSYSDGNVGIGTSSPQNALHVDGTLRLTHPSYAGRISMFASHSQQDNWIQSFTENGVKMWAINMGDRSNGNYFKIWNQVAQSYVFQIKTSGRILSTNGINVRNPGTGSKISLYADNSTHDNKIYSYDHNDNHLWTLNLADRSRNNSVGFYSKAINAFALEITADGKTKTKCLEITGGCDIKEDLNSTEKLEPGDIVILDKEYPGQLKKSDNPYDKKVAGVISGANGINPGLSLSQKDVLEGEYPLTMVGRVYVKATGKIEVGDLLTTSEKPGYAMAAKEKKKAFGTIIGKAMSEQANGEGMVLVLVNLQ